MNERVLQIQRSRVLGALLPTTIGRRVVNRFQNISAQFATIASKSRAPEQTRARARVLLDDQTRRGTIVYFYDFFEDGNEDALPNVLPHGLRYQLQSVGLSHDAYRASPYVIPVDGRPTANGQRYFAGILATRLVPMIAAHE